MTGKKCGGYITVYLALTLGIILSFITTMLAGARNRTVRFQTECVTDIGLESIFAEYHREMLKQYGLLYIDSSYGRGSGSEEAVKSHLLRYMNLNFDTASEGRGWRDLTACHADNASLEEVALSSDKGGQVLDYQINRYMSVKYGPGSLPPLNEELGDPYGLIGEYDGYHSRREAFREEVYSIIEDYNRSLPPDKEPFNISNPADAVEDLNKSNALFYALGEIDGSVFNSTHTDALISHRSYKTGAGLKADQSLPDGSELKTVIIDYIYDKCGYYDHEKDDPELKYEVEYILERNASDKENIEEIAEKIFKMRYVVNMSYLLSSGSKRAEAMALAEEATSIIGLPELTEAVGYTILFAWGYAESAKELRILFDGNGLPAAKNDLNWNTPLEQIVDFKAHLNEYADPGGSLDYKAFLDGFLSVKGTEDINFGLMDVMEMDIRRTPGNSGFKMDDQIYQLSADINVSGDFGYGCSIKRFYSYE